MELSLGDLQSIIIDCVQIGNMEAIRAYEPVQDTIRQSEVKKWLKMMKIDYKAFRALVKKGLITPIHSGRAVNSPLVYSKSEIKQAFTSAKISEVITTDRMSRKE